MHKSQESHNTLSRNLAYLLWRRGIGRESWAGEVGKWVRKSEDRGGELLEGGQIEKRELEQVARELGMEEKEALYADLLGDSGTDVLRENLDFLVGSLAHGRIGRLAEAIGVDRTTVSNWRSGRQRPTKARQLAIIGYFGLAIDTDLEREPLFLSREPVGEAAVRRWTHEHIDKLDPSTLRSLFPALTRLLEER